MALSSDLVSQFAKITKPETKPSEGVVVTGTAKEYDGDIYVRLDGSEQLTPIASSTAGIKDGDRVTVLIKSHTATVTGNVSDPSASQGTVSDIEQNVSDQISEFEIVIADKVSTDQLEAESARIDELVAENVTIKETLTAESAKISDLEADNVTINGKLEAAEADIDSLSTSKLDASVADITYAKIDDLEAVSGDFYTLQADYADFKTVTADDISANTAKIEHLESTMITSDNLDAKYANIDFANIGEAAIEKLFSESGIIGDLVMSDGHVTGTLVGVTIKGDLIEGGTVVADKLVIKGEDGLFYKLNTDGVDISAEQTEYNSLNGSVITAKSITAEKVNVDDLVAFGATIGGFNIDADSLYSGVKSSVDNTTSGVYMDDTGQFSLGNATDYLKFYKDGSNWKLDISASSIKFGSSSTSLEQTITNIQNAAEAAEEAASNANSNASDAAEKADQLEQSLNDYKDVVAGSYATKAELENSGNSILATVEESYQIKGDYVTDEESALILEADGGIVQIGENAGLPPEGITVYGQTRQNLWVNPSGTTKGITVTSNGDGSFTVSGEFSGSGASNISTGSLYTLRPGSTYTVSVDKARPQSGGQGSFGVSYFSSDGTQLLYTRFGGTSSSEGLSVTFVVPANTAFVRCNVIVYSNITGTGTYRIMLNEGSEAQPWCPPGLNSVSKVHAGIGVPATGYDIPYQYGVVAEVDDPGYIVPGDKYSISFLVTRGDVYLNEFRFTTTSQYGVGFHVIEATAKDIGEGASYPGCLLKATYEGGACVGPVSIRRSSEGRSSTEIPLLGNELRSLPDGTRDELYIDADGEVTLTKRVGHIEFDGSQSFVWQSDANGGYWESDDIARMNDYSQSMLCDRLPVKAHSYSEKDLPQSITGYRAPITTYPGQNWVYARTPNATDATQVKTWFTSNPTLLLYQLVEPQTLPLGKVDLPALNAAGANVWVVASDAYGNAYTLEPDIHVSWYGKNANVLGRFASKAELEVTADSIRSEVSEEYLSLESAEDTYAKKSLVTQTADAIRSEVSATYQTKAGMKDYATTSSVTQTANSIRSEVSTQIENIDIGGTNLLLGTAYKNLSHVMVRGDYGTVSIDTSDTVGSRTSLKLVTTQVGASGIRDVLHDLVPKLENKKVVVSFWVKGSVAASMMVRIGGGYTAGSAAMDKAVTTSWSRVVLEMGPLSGNGSPTYVIIAFNKAGTFRVSGMKCEYGNKATDWTPAPEDMLSTADASATYATKQSVTTVEQTVDGLKSTVSSNYTTLNNKFGSYYTKTEVDQKDNSIKSTVSSVQTTADNALEKASTVEQTADGLEVRLTQAEKDVDTAQSTANTANSTANTAQTTATNAAKTATNYLKFDSSGLCVGDMTSGSLGYNTLIKSTGVDIRNGTTTLASFGASQISLGSNSVESNISMCGGTVWLSGQGNLINLASGNASGTKGLFQLGNGQMNINIVNSIISANQAGKVSIQANGGLYKADSYEIFGAKRLYYNRSGTTGNVTLSESAANFDFIDIFFSNNDGYRDCVRVFAPNGNSAVLSNAVYKNEYTTTYVRNKVVTISGTSISVVSNRNGEAQVRQNNSCYAADSTSVIKIYAVWGWK